MGEGFFGSVGERERYVFRAEFGGDGRRLTVKLNSGTLPFRSHHFDIAPADAATPSRAQRLHRGFFGGEARGIAFTAAGSSFAITDFAFGEDAKKKAVAKAFDALADARNLGDVNSGADDHRDIVNWYFTICNLPANYLVNPTDLNNIQKSSPPR